MRLKVKMEKFTKLGLSKELTDVLKGFGFTKPSEIQEKAIPIALAGKDIIGGSATGSGKTLAFASSIIEKLKPSEHIQALILTPTRELAEQVATSIRDFGANKNLSVTAVYGGVKIEPQMKRIADSDILVGTPGRILDHIDRRTLRLDHIKFLVLDEVDRMFDMGFSRDVEKIINECSKKRQTMMFSATISPDIDYLAKKYTKDAVEIAVESQVDPSKLNQVYYDVPDGMKFSLLVHLLKQEKSNFVLVFCGTRRNVDFVASNLINSHIDAKAIHGGLDQKKRSRVLDDFKKKGSGILVCTDVAARGLDIQNVSHVYNYDVPIEPKDYIHRIGRTARAGKEGEAITILASRDYEKFGGLMQLKGVKITPLDLPYIERVSIKVDSDRRDNRFSRGPRRNDSRRDSPNRSRSSDSRGRSDSRGPRRDNPSNGRRLDSRGSSYSRSSDSRSPRRSDSRSSGGRRDSPSNGRRSDSRRSDGPRKSYSSGPRRNDSRSEGPRSRSSDSRGRSDSRGSSYSRSSDSRGRSDSRGGSRPRRNDSKSDGPRSRSSSGPKRNLHSRR